MLGLCSFMAATQRSLSSDFLGKMATPEKYTSCRPCFCSRAAVLRARQQTRLDNVHTLMAHQTCLHMYWVCLYRECGAHCHKTNLASDLIVAKRLLDAFYAVQLPAQDLQIHSASISSPEPA